VPLRIAVVLLGLLTLAGCGGTIIESGNGEQTPVSTGWHQIDPVAIDPAKIGKALNDATTNANGPLIVNVWASNCEPCKDELPLLVRAVNRGKVQVLGLSRDVSADRAKDAMAKYGVTYPNRLDQDADFAVALDGKIPINAIPSSALVVDGMVVAVHVGAFKSLAEIMNGPTS
jgi:thiol-disulfide isomerase/thioredoxin